MRYVMIGGGIASLNAADAIRKAGDHGEILIIGAEDQPPYDRPPLSKGFLHGEPADPDDVHSKFPNFYPDNNINLRIGIKAAKLDPAAKLIMLEDATVERYDRLLLATGSTPRSLDIPGAGLKNVFLLRTIDDAIKIRDAAKAAERIVLIGSGYIGMEVAANLLSRGVKPTIVSTEPQPWARFASEATGKFLQSYFEAHGATFLLEDQPVEILGIKSVAGVRTKNGQTVEADVVVVGVGIKQNLDLAKDAGLEIDDKHGVVTDETLRTPDPNIWAAGDIAAFYDINLGKRWHAEHFLNARWQGQTAGANMAGANQPFDKVPYFFSDMLDLHMALRGDPQGGKSKRLIGSYEAADFTEIYAGDDGVLKMGIVISKDGDKMDKIADQLEEFIRAKTPVEQVEVG